MYNIVLPIKVKTQKGGTQTNFELFKNIGYPSYEAFLEPSDQKDISKFFLVAPSDEIPILKDLVKNSRLPYDFIAEEALVSEEVLKTQEGWYIQQLIKLNVSFLMNTRYYLLLDSDMYLNQPFTFKNCFGGQSLTFGARGDPLGTFGSGGTFGNTLIKYSYEPWQEHNDGRYSTNSNWWTASCKVLNYDLERLKTQKFLMSVTPQLMITELVRDLVKEIKGRLEKDKTMSWQTQLCNMKFTEFSLYWIYLLQRGLTYLYTPCGGYGLSSDKSNDKSNQIPLWEHDTQRNVLTVHYDKNITKSFENKTYFSVIQGYLLKDTRGFIREFNKLFNQRRFLKPNQSRYDAIFLIASMLVPNRQQAFTVEERFNQTIETVLSARKYVPNSYCVIIEGTVISEYAKCVYNDYFDYVIEAGKDSDVLPYINHPTNIGHGEMKLLEKGVDYILKNPEITSDVVFKLGARYSLTDNFCFDKHRYVGACENTCEEKGSYHFFPVYDNVLHMNVYNTGLYSFPYSFLAEFKELLIKGHSVLENNPMIEKAYLELFPKDRVKLLDKLGLQGQLSYNKHYFSV
jgi:hypothetical protein